MHKLLDSVGCSKGLRVVMVCGINEYTSSMKQLRTRARQSANQTANVKVHITKVFTVTSSASSAEKAVCSDFIRCRESMVFENVFQISFQ